MKYRCLYPANWEELALACKQRASWHCEHCGVAHRTPAISRKGRSYIIYLAACHLDHDPWNSDPRLASLCPSCHARYDWLDFQRKEWLSLEAYRHQMLVNAHLVQFYGLKGGLVMDEPLLDPSMDQASFLEEF